MTFTVTKFPNFWRVRTPRGKVFRYQGLDAVDVVTQFQAFMREATITKALVAKKRGNNARQ